MKRLNWNCGLSCLLLVVSACGGKANDEDKDDASTASDNGDGDADTANETTGDGDGDGGTDSPTSYGDKEESCQSVCNVAESCGFSDDDCVQSCSESTAVSNAGQDALAVCFEDFNCSADEADLRDAFLCISDELEDTPLSDEQRKFCDVTSQNVRECTGDEPDSTLGDCAEQIGLVSDELLAEVNACDQTDCDDLTRCVGLQTLQEVDFSEVTRITSGGDLSARGLSDLMALFILSNQLGTETGLEGAGGASGAP